MSAGQSSERVTRVCQAPTFDTLKGLQFYAKDSDGQWYYVNHANTWQTMPPPVEPALSTPATTGEGEVERLKAGLKDEINFDINTRVNKVPESVVDQVVDLLAERGVLTIAALPPSSGPVQMRSTMSWPGSPTDVAFNEGFAAAQTTSSGHKHDTGTCKPNAGNADTSGRKAGAEAMREAAARTAENAHLVEPDGGSPTEDEAAVASEAARRIRALPLPPPPSREPPRSRTRAEYLEEIAACRRAAGLVLGAHGGWMKPPPSSEGASQPHMPDRNNNSTPSQE